MTNILLKTVTYSAEMAAINAIRTKVFQEEQGVDPKLEFDGRDETADHLLAYLNNRPVGTARIRYLDGETAKIERLAVLPPARGRGIGKQLMAQAIAVAAQKDVKQVVVNAQEYVKGLYLQLGFVQEGGIFDEAGIPHVKMRKV
ncbi:MAG: GNAT family N-acetyltransferase [Hormoscilla sp. GUM202]|nr:GNAT family N-acetyltransferase [Hormoscilla sp. GUM202]